MLNALLKLGMAWVEEQKPIRIYQDRCLHARHQASNCAYCEQVCPQQALQIKPQLEVDFSCTDCGLCVAVCPTEALERKKERNNQYYQRIKKDASEKEELLFYCKKLKEPLTQGTELQCLGMVDEVVILLAQAEGVKRISFISGQCDTCPWRRGGELLKEKVEKWEKLYTSLEIDLIREEDRSIEQKKQNGPLDAKEEEYDRRTFFKLTTQKTKNIVFTNMLKKEENPWQNGELKREKPIRLQVRERWIIPKIQNPIFAETIFFVNDRCTQCGICEKVCPTAAVEIDQAAGNVTINPDRCISCNLCRDVCFRDAIDVQQIPIDV